MSELKRKRVPFIKEGNEAALAYVKWHFNDKSKFRSREMTRMSRNLWMVKHGRHWITYNAQLVPTSSGHRWVDVLRDGNPGLPRPVDNMVGEGVKNFVSRVVRKQYEPVPIPDDRDPELEAAARLNRDVLLFDMKKAKFASAHEAVWVDDLVVYGTAVGIHRLDETFDQMAVVASTTAAKCVACGSLYASKSLDPRKQSTEGLYGLDRATKAESGELEFEFCPKCENSDMGKLEMYMPSRDEAEHGKDAFGRPLGSYSPKCEAIWESPSPFEVYPENGGKIDTHLCKILGIAKVRPMSWVETHVQDEAVLAKIHPQEPAELMKHDPLMSDPWFRAASGVDEDVYADHVMVKELIVEPLDVGGDGKEHGLRWGRHIIAIGDEVVLNTVLLREVKDSDKKVCTIKFKADVAEKITGQFWGKTPVDDACPLNQQYNRLAAIYEDLCNRGVAFLAVPSGVEFEARNDRATGAMRVFEFDDTGRAGGWNPKDALVNATPLTGNAFMPRMQELRESIQRSLGPTPAESGLDGGADSARQLQIQAEEAAAKLGPVDEARVNIVEAMLCAHSDVVWAFRREDGEYERETAAGTFERRAYNGTEILGQTKIKLEAKGTLDRVLLQAQLTEKALVNMQLYGPIESLDQSTRDELLELMQMPKLKDAKSIQIKRADQAWSDFERERKIPYIDTTVQDTWIWYQRLGKHWQSDEAMELQASVGWDEALRKLAGWPAKLKQAEEQDALQRAVYEGHPPENWPAIYEEGAAKAQMANQAATQVAGATGQPVPPMPAFPQPPPTGAFLPESLCDRLLMLWRKVLGLDILQDPKAQAVMQLVPKGDPQRAGLDTAQALDQVLQMYAVIQECRLDAASKQSAVDGGASLPASPGGSMTPTGGVPGGQASVVPTAGAEQAFTGGA